MTFIWSTRGRTWGFRFLRNGGITDPFVDYKRAFEGVEHEREVWRRTHDAVALRFPSPNGLRDSAGRVIPQEFVLFGDLAAQVNTVQDGIEKVWPLVKEEFELTWDLQEAPSADS